MTTTITVRASVDAYADQEHTATNYGSKNFIRLNATGAAVNYGYLAFPINLPDDATVTSATLTLYTVGAQVAKTTTVDRLTQKWVERTLTWANKPSVSGVTANSGAVSPAAGGAVTIDVTTIVGQWVSGKANYGLRVSTDSVADVEYYSTEAGNQRRRPVLAITYARTPDAPTNLAPDGGGVVGTSTPLLKWDSVTPASVYVQVDDDSAFGSPLVDSGWITSVARVFDLADNFLQVITLSAFDGVDSFKLTYGGAEGATTFTRGTNATAAALQTALRTQTGDTGLTVTGTTDAGPFTVLASVTGLTAITVTSPVGCTGAVTNGATLADGTTYYWRVKIKDENSIASAYSTAAEFAYNTQGALTISAPAGATVTSAKPTVTWSLATRTQAYYQLLVDNVADGNIYDSGRLAGAVVSMELPAGTISDESETYTIKVRTWDTFDRIANGASKDYVQTTASVTLTTGAGTAPTSLVAITQLGHVYLTWSQTGTPDSFTIKKDGKVVVDDLALADCTLGGTSYGYKVWDGDPWLVSAGTNTWAVQSETSSILTTKATTTLAFAPIGAYLAEEESQVEVRLLGQEDLDATLGESGATFYPLGRRDPVRIVDSVRGYEGNFQGTLAAYAGVTVATHLANLYTLVGYASAGKEMRLVVGHWNLPVRVSNFTVRQLAAAGEAVYEVSFDFVQTSEFDVVVAT